MAMDKTPSSALRGVVVDDELELTVIELSRVCGTSPDEVGAWVVEGVVQPQGNSPAEWRFTGAALRRVRVASRLSRDLEISASGVALVVDLLDRIAALEARLQREGVLPPRA